MTNVSEKIPIRRLMLLILGGLATYLLIPVVLTRYNDVKLLQEARLARAVKFGDHNAEFVGRIHGQSTLLRMFIDHNERMNISGVELKEARKDLHDNYRKRYLEMDATEWWWPWEFEREVAALGLLSPDEMKRLSEYVNAYNISAEQSIIQPIHLWHFLDSPGYKVRDKKSNEEIKKLSGRIDKAFRPEYEKRAELVKKIAALFAQSNFRTEWRDIAGLRW